MPVCKFLAEFGEHNFLLHYFNSLFQQLEQKQALARQLADLLHFTLKFDAKKMEKAQIQNDYSSFR
mgnify:CR=1 FL=1